MSAFRWIGAVLRPEVVLALLMGLLVGLLCGYQTDRSDRRAIVNNYGGRLTVVVDPDPSIPPRPSGVVGGAGIPQISLSEK